MQLGLNQFFHDLFVQGHPACRNKSDLVFKFFQEIFKMWRVQSFAQTYQSNMRGVLNPWRQSFKFLTGQMFIVFEQGGFIRKSGVAHFATDTAGVGNRCGDEFWERRIPPR